MNNLIITKNGWMDDYIVNIANIGEFSHPPKEMVQTCRFVISIMKGEVKSNHIELIFPERFYPNNATGDFWKHVHFLMKLGHTVTAKTSDLFAGRIPLKGADDISRVGWDSIKIIRPDNSEIVNPKLYGRNTSDLLSDYPF